MFKAGIIVVAAFIGFMVATAGAVVFPELMRVTAPVICSSGKFSIVSQEYSTRPGEAGVMRTFYCVDNSGKRQDISFPTLGVGFVIYTIGSYAVLLVLSIFARIRNAGKSPGLVVMPISQVTGSTGSEGLARKYLHASEPDEEDPTARLQKLKEMLDAQLITQQEFDAKKAEILARL